MNEATKKTLSQFKELTDSEQHDARQKFARMREATQIYHMSRTKLAEEDAPYLKYKMLTKNSRIPQRVADDL